MKKVLRRAALALAIVLGALVLLFAGYVGYLQLQYYRIEDNLALEVANAPAEPLAAGEEYTAVTCNLGFGAYGPDYSFFMDAGVMEDGTPTQGLYGKARSEEDVLANTAAGLDALEELDADLLLLQEVDYDSHRSHFVDQRQMALDAFSDHGSIWGQNFHSGYLAYPLTDHHGVVNAGLLTLTRYAAATRWTRVSSSSSPTWTAASPCCICRWRAPTGSWPSSTAICPPTTRAAPCGHSSWNCCAT